MPLTATLIRQEFETSCNKIFTDLEETLDEFKGSIDAMNLPSDIKEV